MIISNNHKREQQIIFRRKFSWAKWFSIKIKLQAECKHNIAIRIQPLTWKDVYS